MTSTLLLAEFLAAVSAADDEEAMLRTGLERAAEAVDAEVAAIVVRGRPWMTIGYGDDAAPAAELLAVCGGAPTAPVPGAGLSPALALDLEHPDHAHLVIARAGPNEFSSEERGLLRAMARVLSLVLAGNRTQAAERRLNDELRERHQQLQRLVRVTSSIPHGAPLADVLDTIVSSAAELLGQEVVGLRLIRPDDPSRVDMVAHRGIGDDLLDLVVQAPAEAGVGGRAIIENRVIAVDHYSSDGDMIAAFRAHKLQRAMAAPVNDQGAVVGSLTVASYQPGTYTELEKDLLAMFAEHASLALSDARRVAATTHQALHDDLTGLPNRTLFLDRLEHSLVRAGQNNTEVAVLFCDVDQFKLVNDRLGHSVGDALLIAVGDRIGGCLRAADTAARFGGDEFAVLLEDSSQGEAETVADRILGALRPGAVVHGRELPIGASIGLAMSSHTAKAEELLRFADLAMYRAKALGRGRYEVFETSMWSDMEERAELETELRAAIAQPDGDGDLTIVYQPILDLLTLDLVGVEALARWRHPRQGEIEPELFIAVAEEAGLIVELGRSMLRRACRQVRLWRDRFGLAVAMSVNVSAHQLDDARLVDDVIAAINEAGIEPQQLVLEINETVVMQDTGSTAADRLLALKAIGVRLAIDGFGTGYSSLGYLKRLPVDALKIDKSLVQDVERSSRDRALVRTVLSLGETLGLDMIAEGIESVEQLRALRRIGCQQGQGFHLCAPMSATELERILPGSLGQPMEIPAPR
jgi:diguanylate cyclase (GGDEF)-like protein